MRVSHIPKPHSDGNSRGASPDFPDALAGPCCLIGTVKMTPYPDSERSNDGHSRGRPQSQTLVHLRRPPARVSTREAVLVTASPMTETHPGNVWDVWGLGHSMVLLVSANSVNESSLIFPAGCASHIYRHRATGSGMAEMRRRRP